MFRSTRAALAAVLLAAAGCQTPGPVAPDPARESSSPSTRTAEESVNPGFNKTFLSEDLDVGRYVARFESESREIARERDRIVETVGLRPGEVIADVGAGTGLFVEPFSRAVGSSGRVYAVEIAQGFVDRIQGLARERGLDNVEAVLCSEDSVDLPDGSIDVAFICDTYHHFEYPRSTMTSIHRALRAGGRVVVVDFIRIEGQSRDWVLEHVRAGREEFSREIEAVGFRRLPDAPSDFLQENYIIRFEKR